MMPLLHAARMLVLMALGACSAEKHAFDRHLAQLRPDTVTALPDMGWPAGTMLCPLSLYQSALAGSAPLAGRVNAFLKKKQFLGGEDWSLIVVRPLPAGEAGIEQLFSSVQTMTYSTSRNASGGMWKKCQRALRRRLA